MQELLLPEASSMLLTTGNLADVTKEAGPITSLAVAGDLYVGGSAVLGAAGAGGGTVSIGAQVARRDDGGEGASDDSMGHSRWKCENDGISLFWWSANHCCQQG